MVPISWGKKTRLVIGGPPGFLRSSRRQRLGERFRDDYVSVGTVQGGKKRRLDVDTGKMALSELQIG